MKQFNLTQVSAIILIVILTAFVAQTSKAQYTKLHTFDAFGKGSNPYSYVTLSGNVLYGTTGFGGTNGNGILFKVNTDGSGFTKMVDFDGVNKGTNPFGSLTLSGNELFGMTAFGGTNGQGVIYKINNDGSGFIKLVDFGGAIDGAFPRGALTLVGTQLYGMTQGGGTTGNGIIFKINNDGTGFTKLLDFDGPNKGRAPIGSSLTLSGAVLYGMTNSGGLNDDGIVFKMNADGTGFTKLLDFDGVNKGAFPFTSSPTLSNNVLYSTTQVGGTNGKGVLFKMNTDGTGFTKLVDFDGTTKGSRPLGSVTVIGNTIYGMTSEGGVNNKGVMFKVNTNGSGFTKLVEFDDINTGMRPYNTLIPSGNILFGMVSSEGSTANLGTVFKYALPLTNQTITFNPIPPKTFGDADFDPGALTSSGLPVIYGSSDTTVATIVNNKVHIVAAGTATIVANQPGNGSFNPAPSQSQLITVNKAALVATADNKTKIFLDDNPPLTISYTGFVNGDTPASITEPTATTSAKFNSFVGTYPIILSGGFAANYLLTLVNGTLTIVDQPIIMPDNSASKAISNKKTMLTNDMINLSVADDTYAGLNIYPNPVNDELYIKNSIPITKIEIINMANQVLISKEFNSVTGVTINTSTLLRGMYTIKVFDITGKVSTNKIVKE